MNIGASHLPVVCTWSACVPAGAAVKSTLINTPLDVSRSVAVPMVFPIASLIVADAVPDGACANASEPVSRHAETVASVFMEGKVTKSREIRRKPEPPPSGARYRSVNSISNETSTATGSPKRVPGANRNCLAALIAS